MHSGRDATQISECGGDADHAVAAHAKVSGIIEENYAGCGCRIDRLNQQCANQDLGTPRLTENGAAVNIMFVAQLL